MKEEVLRGEGEKGVTATPPPRTAFEPAELEFIRFSAQDVITTSSGTGINGIEDFFNLDGTINGGEQE